MIQHLAGVRHYLKLFAQTKLRVLAEEFVENKLVLHEPVLSLNLIKKAHVFKDVLVVDFKLDRLHRACLHRGQSLVGHVGNVLVAPQLVVKISPHSPGSEELFNELLARN